MPARTARTRRSTTLEDIPFSRIEGLFLDAGNTLVTMDFEYLGRLAGGHGLYYSADVLERAEAAARAAVDRWLARGARRSTESEKTLRVYVEAILTEAAARDGRESPPEDLAERTAALSAELARAEVWDRLWTRVAPGVAESLAALKERGLRLAVVSNADGTVEAKLARAGLAGLFDLVLDSAVVGIEKPDPAIWRLGLEALALSPATCIHLGDLNSVDVKGARRAGLHAVLIDPYGDRRRLRCPRVPSVVALAARLLAAG